MSWMVNRLKVDVGTDGKFYLPNWEDSVKWSTLEEAKKGAEAIAKRIRTSLDLPCIQNTGAAVLLKRLHLGTGDFITEPAQDGRYGPRLVLFPANDIVRELVEQRVTLKRQLDAVEEKLKPYQLRSHGGRQRDGAEAEVRKDWEAKQALAAELEGVTE